MDLNSVRTDPSLENDGVWFDLQDDARMKIASSGTANKGYAAAIRRATQESAVLGGANREIPDDKFRIIVADHLVRDFDGFQDDGKPYPYSVENARTMIANHPPILRFVLEKAGQFDAYLVAQETKAAGN